MGSVRKSVVGQGTACEAKCTGCCSFNYYCENSVVWNITLPRAAAESVEESRGDRGLPGLPFALARTIVAAQ